MDHRPERAHPRRPRRRPGPGAVPRPAGRAHRRPAPPCRPPSAATSSSRSTGGATATAPRSVVRPIAAPVDGPGPGAHRSGRRLRRGHLRHRLVRAVARRRAGRLRHVHRRRRALDAPGPRRGDRRRCSPTPSPTPAPRRWPGCPTRTGFAYTRYPDPAEVGDDEAGYHRTVWWHRLGDDAADDTPCFTDLPDKEAWPEVSLSSDGRWLLVHVERGLEPTDVHLLDRAAGPLDHRHRGRRGHHLAPRSTSTASASSAPPRSTRPRAGWSPRSLGDPAPERWVDLVPEGDDVLTGFAAHRRPPRCVLRTRAGVSSLHHHEPSGAPRRRGHRRHRRAGGGHRPGQPPQRTRASSRWRTRPSPGPTPSRPGDPTRQPVELTTLPGPGDRRRRPSARCATRRPTAPRCRCSLVHAAGTTIDARTPTLLTGYGGFNITETPAWSPFIAAWCELGGQVADPRPARRRRGGRGLAPGRHARQQAAGVRRLRGGRRLARAPRAARHATGSPSAAAPTAGCSSPPARCAAPTCAGPSCATCRSPTWCASRASSSPASGSPSTATPTCPRSWPGSTPTRRTTRWSTAPPTRPRSSPPARRTAASTRATPASTPPASRRRRRNEVLLRVESAAGHGQGKPATKQIEERADVLAFLA